MASQKSSDYLVVMKPVTPWSVGNMLEKRDLMVNSSLLAMSLLVLILALQMTLLEKRLEQA